MNEVVASIIESETNDEVSPAETVSNEPAKEAGGGDASCTEYRIDMAAAIFGQCKCGRAKSEHTPKALSGGRSPRKKVAKAPSHTAKKVRW